MSLYRPVESICLFWVFKRGLDLHQVTHFRAYEGKFMYHASSLTKVKYFIDFVRSQNYMCGQIGISRIWFPSWKWIILKHFTKCNGQHVSNCQKNWKMLIKYWEIKKLPSTNFRFEHSWTFTLKFRIWFCIRLKWYIRNSFRKLNLPM